MADEAGSAGTPSDIPSSDTDGDWVAVLPAADLPDASPVAVDLGGFEILLYRTGDRLYAIGDRCTHANGPLHRGRIGVLSGEPTVTCPLHGSLFRLSDGRLLRGPAMRPEPAFDVRERDGSVEIRDRA
jgi:nitrite reductase/ring-hydroxylating ferredoxin subunit